MSREPNPYASPSHEMPPPVGEQSVVDVHPRESVEYQFTEEDWLNYAEHINTKSPSAQRLYHRQRMRFVLLSVVIAGLTFVLTMDGDFVALPVALSAVAFLLLLRAFRLRQMWGSLTRERFKMILDEGGTSNLFGRRRLLILDNGLQIDSDTGHRFVKWWAISRLARTTDYLYIYLSPMEAVPVPARVFATVSDFDAFGDLIQQRMKQHADQRTR